MTIMRAALMVTTATLLAMALPAWSYDPLDAYEWNGCPTDVGGGYDLTLPGQQACDLLIESTLDDGLGPVKVLFRSALVSCDGGAYKPVLLHYQTAPGSCVLTGDISVRTLVIVDDDTQQWQAVNGSWSGMVSAGNAADEACQATDHWYSNIIPSDVYAFAVSAQPDGGSLFRCRVDGWNPYLMMQWSTESNDFRIYSVSGGPIEMRADATYRVDLEVGADGVLEDDRATVTTRSPSGESWSDVVVTAVPR